MKIFFKIKIRFYVILLKISLNMRVLTSLFSAGREGTDKGEGVPPRAVCCIWSVCYNGGTNGEQPPSGLP
nr:MAG TPA: hypothetical protein [Caudoviricetes sp.]